jgi:hypothetical protein
MIPTVSKLIKAYSQFSGLSFNSRKVPIFGYFIQYRKFQDVDHPSDRLNPQIRIVFWIGRDFARFLLWFGHFPDRNNFPSDLIDLVCLCSGCSSMSDDKSLFSWKQFYSTRKETFPFALVKRNGKLQFHDVEDFDDEMIVLIVMFPRVCVKSKSLFVVLDLDLRLRQSSGGEPETHLNNHCEKILRNDGLRKRPSFRYPLSFFNVFWMSPGQLKQVQIQTFRGYALNGQKIQVKIQLP